MNYRHIYHAGNFADVIKHLVLLQVLEHLKQKEKGFFVLDTHAGIGLYDLNSEQAIKTREYKDGFFKITHDKSPPDSLQKYQSLVKFLNKKDITHYPGSPYLTAMSLRPQDRLIACELHPEDAQTLSKNLQKFINVTTNNRNGYEAIKALLPPEERRGLVLIDPPFEERTEFQTIVTALQQALKRWSSGIYIIWYPIKNPLIIKDFHKSLGKLSCKNILVADFYLRKPENMDILNGCGIAIINPPWKLDTHLSDMLLPYLTKILGEQSSYYHLAHLTPSG